jgi:hypothetical protein
MHHLANRLLRTTAAAIVLTLPVQAAEPGSAGVYYRLGPHVFEQPIPLPGQQPVAETGPLSVETEGSTDLVAGEPLQVHFKPKGGRSADWKMTYTGARPAWLNIVESGQDVVLSAAAVPFGADIVLSVSLTDKIETLPSSKVLKVAPALSIASAAGASVAIAAGAAWNFAFDAAGGKAPYVFELTPPLTGDLANVVSTPAATRLTLTGTAPAGTYAMSVRTTDAGGRVATSSLNVVSQVVLPAVGVAPSEVVNAFGGVVDIARNGELQPDWNILYDGDNATGWVKSKGTTEPMASGVRFAAPVTFDKIHYRGSLGGTVWIKENGSWVNAGTTQSTNGTTTLTRIYTATEVKIGSNNGLIYELRVGLAPATTATPTRANTNANSVPLVANATSFRTTNPYAKTFSYADTPTEQNGVVLSVSATEVRVVTRPLRTTDIFVWVKDDTGMTATLAFQIKGTLNDTLSIYPRPSGYINAKGGDVDVVRAGDDQPDWNVMMDDDRVSWVRSSNNTEVGASGYKFDAVTTFDKLYYYGNSGPIVWVLENGVWKNAGTYTTTDGVITLPRAYAATAVKLSTLGNRIYELRIGNTAAVTAKPRRTGGSDIVTSQAANVVAVRNTNFGSDSVYARTFSVADTPTEQNGVVLSVSETEVRVVSRPAKTTDVFVHVTDDTGMVGYVKVQVQVGGSATSIYGLPSGFINPLGGNTSIARAAIDQPDWQLLVDDDDDSYVWTSSAITGEGGAGLTFAQPTTFDRVSFRASASVTVFVKENGVWINVGGSPYSSGRVDFARPYTATAVVIASDRGKVYELRAGPALMVPLPSVTTTGATYVPYGNVDVASASSFTSLNPFASTLSLAATPTEQNGVVLSVAANRVTVVSRPTKTVDVFLNITDDTGLTTWIKYQIRGSTNSNVSLYDAPNGIINAYGGTTNVVRSPVGQPDWNILVDGLTTTSVSSSGTTEAQASGLTFASPIRFDRFHVNSTAAGETIWIQENGVWLDAGKLSTTVGTHILGRPYLATAIKLSLGSSAKIQELRIGAGPAVAY